MSRLKISGTDRDFDMNVTAFTSPVYGSISSAQTRTKAIHFPTKISQPEIQFDVIFSSETNFEDFQKFVRNHQQHSLATASLLTLWWPERNIFNWTGVISQFQAGGARINYTPRARFTVDLVDSMVSARTSLASWSTGWRSIYGAFGPVDAVLRIPSVAEAMDIAGQYGQNIYGGGTWITPSLANPVPTGTAPVAASPLGPGIVSGSGMTL